MLKIHECWKKRCVVLHEPEVQSKVLQNQVLAIVQALRKEEAVGLREFSEVHSMNAHEISVEEMLLWVRSVRIFKKKS